MSEKQKRGAFIVVEGLDRSGKSTQTTMLMDRLQRSGVDAKLIKFPDRTTPIGKMIDSYLKSESELDDHAIHLLFSANRWELASTIEKTLRAGTLVVCDRYAFSGVAFSAGKGLPGLTYEWCRASDVSLPAPDLTIFLDVSPDKAADRGGFGDERYEKEELQLRVRDVFERIGMELGEGEQGSWVPIDADMEKDEVAAEVWKAVEPLSKGLARPIQKLWDDHSERLKDRTLQLYT